MLTSLWRCAGKLQVLATLDSWHALHSMRCIASLLCATSPAPLELCLRVFTEIAR
jgi:hypothetical protein